MRVLGAGAVIAALLAAGVAPSEASTSGRETPAPTAAGSAATIPGAAPPKQVPPLPARKAGRPDGPNPYLALLPKPATPREHAAWDRYLAAAGERRMLALERDRARSLDASPLLVDEDEPDGLRGSNDTPGSAQQVPGFGTRSGVRSRLRVLGTASPERVTPRRVSPSREDDGSIPLARDTRIGPYRPGVVLTGVIGDGPHGSAGTGTGDFDVLAVRARAGQVIDVDTDTPGGTLDSMVIVYDAEGNEVAFNDDDGVTLASALRYQVPVSGTYYVLVSGFFSLPEDPFDSASGFGFGSEGPYRVRVTVAADDVDVYAVRLRKGDVLGASLDGAATRVAVLDPAPRIEDVHGSSQDASFLYPATSRLPGGGNAVTDHVADQAGWHYLAVEQGDGDYDLTVEAYRPGGLGARGVQTLFLDLDGERLNTGVFGGPGVRTLSPLRAFLARWGLRNADLDPLVDSLVAEVRENLAADVRARGGSPQAAVRVLNSRDHADPWGRPNVTRVVVGGTIEQSGVPTIGIAQTIDPGNFETEESALVLLDVLSGPRGDEASLNTYLRPRSRRVDFIGQALGTVVSHEAGHVLGGWHTDPFDTEANVLDAGGSFAQMFGVGPDRVGGTADDVDVDLGEGTFDPFEGFTGVEDTLTRVARALTRVR